LRLCGLLSEGRTALTGRANSYQKVQAAFVQPRLLSQKTGQQTGHSAKGPYKATMLFALAVAGLQRHQLRGRRPGFRTSEVASILNGPWGFVLLHVGPVDSVFQAVAPRPYGADGDLAPGDLDHAAWLFEKRPVPASWLQAPRPHENATFDYHNPDAMKRCGCWPARMPRILLLWIAAKMSAVKRRFAFILCVEGPPNHLPRRLAV
jgi:hypothetical protein